jgi:AcrR family transcriptional regulator
MRRLAEELDIRAPSLYKHLAGKRAIEIALIEVAFAEIGQELHDAIGDGSAATAIPDLLCAYRRRGTAEPNLYRLATAGRLPRADLTAGLEDWAGAPFAVVAREPNLAQALWSFAHGMVVLEIDGRYPAGSDLDRTWAAGAAAFCAAATGA